MSLDEILEFADGRPLVLDIQHDSCAPCQDIAPGFEALMERTKETYPDTLFFNIDAMDFANRDLLMNGLKISSVPSFRIYVNGELSASVNGGNNFDQVEAELQKAIAKHEVLSDDGLNIVDDTSDNV
ncbi:MAG: thioredoxin family protein [FCB group bacterium]|nr:thioredoxin family protein [FCB group bacterium]